jgi:hypothetical protein
MTFLKSIQSTIANEETRHRINFFTIEGKTKMKEGREPIKFTMTKCRL